MFIKTVFRRKKNIFQRFFVIKTASIGNDIGDKRNTTTSMERALLTMESKATPSARRLLACIYFTSSFIFLEEVAKSAAGSTASLDIRLIMLSALPGIAAGMLSTLLRSSKSNAVIGSVILLLAAVAVSVEAVLFRAFGYFYPPEIFFGMAGAVAGSYLASAFSAILSALPYILLCLLPLALYILVHLRFGTLTAFSGSGAQKRAAFVLGAVLLGAVVQYTAVEIVHSEPEAEYLYSRAGYDFSETAKQLGILTSLRLSLCYSFRPQSESTSSPSEDDVPSPSPSVEGYNVTSELSGYLSEDTDETLSELVRYLSARKPSEKNEMTGIFADKDLIFICAEALSPYAISETLTPTLYRMMTTGVRFSEYYAPTFGESTSGGEYALLLSQVPKRDAGERGMSMYLSRNNRLDHSLPGYFSANGYMANGYHNNSYTYYDRHLTHPAMGMNWYGCGGCVTLSPDAPRLDLDRTLSRGWPRSDSELINATFPSYADGARAHGQHYFTYYLTVSGHSNYSFTGNVMSAKNRHCTDGLEYPETVKAYLSAQKELDIALETLIKSLEADGSLDDTVIVVANDHHPYGLCASWATNGGSDYLSALAGHKLSTTPQIERGVLMIYNSALPQGIEVTKPICSFDVLPTILNMFGFEYDSRLFCGRDAFSSGDGLAFFSDGSFVTARGTYDARTKAFAPASGYEDDMEYARHMRAEIRSMISHSKLVRRTDLFAHLPGNKNEDCDKNKDK